MVALKKYFYSTQPFTIVFNLYYKVAPNLKKIIKGCIDGDIKAQKQLFEIFQKKMFGLCLRYSKDYTEAEDISQDGFIKVFENIKQFNNVGSIENWMKKIMINTALLHYKKKRKNLYIIDDVQYYNEPDFQYDDIINQISAKELLGIIKELSPKYKVVFNMYAIDGYKHKEISKILGISIGTSKSNLLRARSILKEKVEKLYNDTIDNYRLKNVKG